MNARWLCIVGALILWPFAGFADDANSFTYSLGDRGVVLRTSVEACFICGRNHKDFESLSAALIALANADLTKATDEKNQIAAVLIKQATDISASISSLNRGALDFPVQSARKDIEVFSKKVPNLQSILDYAAKEQISEDRTLSDALELMR